MKYLFLGGALNLHKRTHLTTSFLPRSIQEKMQHENDYNAIVIIGNWNISIFSEEWVKKFLLTEEKELEIEVPLQSGNSIRYSTSDFRFFITGVKLCFSILNTKSETYEKIVKYALRTIEVLQHTPITAYGINFNLKISETQIIEPILHLTDSESLADAYILKETNISRVFDMPELECVLNHIIINSSDGIIMKFNFHSEATTLTQFKSHFDFDTFQEKQKIALDILNNIYRLQLAKSE